MEFETERLRLRPWTMDDVEAAYEIYRDAEVMRFLGGTAVASVEEQRDRLQKSIDRHFDWPDGQGSWAMVEKDGGRIVGTALLKPLPGHDEIEVGWHLGRFAWGNGYATEAGRRLLQHGFGTLRLQRIVAVVDPLNHRSQAVARRLGMAHSGRVRAYDMDLEFFVLEKAE